MEQLELSYIYIAVEMWNVTAILETFWHWKLLKCLSMGDWYVHIMIWFSNKKGQMTDTYNRDKSQRYAEQNKLDTKEYIYISWISNFRIQDGLL